MELISFFLFVSRRTYGRLFSAGALERPSQRCLPTLKIERYVPASLALILWVIMSSLASSIQVLFVQQKFRTQGQKLGDSPPTFHISPVPSPLRSAIQHTRHVHMATKICWHSHICPLWKKYTTSLPTPAILTPIHRSLQKIWDPTQYPPPWLQ